MCNGMPAANLSTILSNMGSNAGGAPTLPSAPNKAINRMVPQPFGQNVNNNIRPGNGIPSNEQTLPQKSVEIDPINHINQLDDATLKEVLVATKKEMLNRKFSTSVYNILEALDSLPNNQSGLLILSKEESKVYIATLKLVGQSRESENILSDYVSPDDPTVIFRRVSPMPQNDLSE